MTHHRSKPNMNGTKPPDDGKRTKHFIEQARETAKQLDTRALLIIVPLVFSSYKVYHAATPHVEEFQSVAQQIAEKDTRRAAVLSDVNAETMSRERVNEGGKRIESKKLSGLEYDNARNLEAQSKELRHAQRDALRRLKMATVELSLAGPEKTKFSLFFVAILLQAFSLAALSYLWFMRRRVLMHLVSAQRCCILSGLKPSDYTGMALPTSPLVYPLPRWGTHAVGIRRFLDETQDSAKRGLPLYLVLAIFVGVNAWLMRLNFRIFDILEPKLSWDALQFLMGCSLGATVVVLCLDWLLDSSVHSNSDSVNVDRRLYVALPLAGLLGGVVGASTKFAFLQRITRSLRQLPHRMLERQPRFKVKRYGPLKTSAIVDGFLYNKKKDIWHVVRAGVVMGVRDTPQARLAFSKFSPVAENFSTDMQRLPRIANHKTVFAVERAVNGIGASGFPGPADIPRSLDILARIVGLYLSKLHGSLPIRLLDVYAKLAVRHYEDKRLDQFLANLKQNGLASKITDRMQKWSAKDAKDNKWRTRVRTCARSSNGGYPVAGRCEFESRPNTPHRH